jgi:hypothetical protein
MMLCLPLRIICLRPFRKIRILLALSRMVCLARRVRSAWPPEPIVGVDPSSF